MAESHTLSELSKYCITTVSTFRLLFYIMLAPAASLPLQCRHTLSALMTMARSSIGLRPAKSTTCEMSSSEGSVEAMVTDGRSQLYGGNVEIVGASKTLR